MQVQLRVIGKRGKSDSVSVDNVRKDSHIPTRTVLDPGLSLMAPYKLDCYLRQGGYVFIGVYSFICLLASKITQKLLRRFSRDSVERRHVYHGRTHYSLVVVQIALRYVRDRVTIMWGQVIHRIIACIWIG